ncbi:BadF/BadG/BcrA/BcrD ATPase family protein [Thioclava atlantica]|uniref:BadF/BadG/BcrA/BcrD family ATPase n=1 Tax=Thioclava atlantica TaxID=1317124 RepID=A0A085TVQ1_9RHOB|nr:BadF/BadG/BcrA/BcrD ATPase family protein [Thioclava atlantica]KFE34798.1 BadF/BadG/BcrA/BcrD family ATPase [Thioclava atlantica]
MHFLGVDGGGTGCRAVLADATGRVIGRGEAGPANIASDFGGALANILAACDAAMAGFAPGELRAVLGLAGANLSGQGEMLVTRLPFRARVVQDVTISVRGALGREDGIVAALGTGSVFARQLDGHLHTIGGWGLRLGDEGSGAWIGRALGARAARALDGFCPLTPLLRTLLEQMDGGAGLLRFSLSATPADWAALAPRVLGSEDPAAVAIRSEAASDIREAIALLQPESDLPVTWIGGLGPTLALPDWPSTPARGSALDGALSLAMEDAFWSE